MTYQEIRKQQAGSNPWLQSLSPEDYSRVMAQITGDQKSYASGIDPGWLSQADYAINRMIGATGAPELAGQLGEETFGTTGRQVFEGIPRATVNMLPMLIPGGGWAAAARNIGTGALTGLETWGATEKVLPTALAGGLAVATPKIMETAGGAAIQAMKTPADAAQAATLRAMMAEGSPVAANLAAHTTAPTTTGQVLAGIGAGQAALTGAQTGIEAVNIGFDEDRSFKELLSPEYWAAQGLAQAAFGTLDAARIPGQIRQANRMRGMLTTGDRGTVLGTSSPLEAGIGLTRPPAPEGPVYGPEPDQRLALYVQDLARGAPEPAAGPAGPMVQPELLGMETAATPPPEATVEPLVKPPVSQLPPEQAVARLFSDLGLPQAEGIRALATPEQLAHGEKIANEVVNNGGTPEQGVEAGKNVILHQLREQHAPRQPEEVQQIPNLEQDMEAFAARQARVKENPAIGDELKLVIEESTRFGDKDKNQGAFPDPTYGVYREWVEGGEQGGFEGLKKALREKVDTAILPKGADRLKVEMGPGIEAREAVRAWESDEGLAAWAEEPVLSTVPDEGPVIGEPAFMRNPQVLGEEMAGYRQAADLEPDPIKKAQLEEKIAQVSVDKANLTRDDRFAHAGTYFGKLMRGQGMSEAEMAQRLPTVARLWTAVKELAGTDLAQLTTRGRQAHGLFVAGDHPLVMLSADPKSSKLLGYTVAHELIGHGLWDAHARGQLEPKVSMQLDRTRKFVTGALPEDRALMLKWMTEGLPAELRKSPELAEILRTAETVQSPDEVLAHMNALAAMHMVEGRTSNLSGLVKYLPKPLSDFLVNAAQWASKSIRTLKMAFRGNKEMWDTLAGHEEAMKDVMRAGRETEVDALGSRPLPRCRSRAGCSTSPRISTLPKTGSPPSSTLRSSTATGKTSPSGWSGHRCSRTWPWRGRTSAWQSAA